MPEIITRAQWGARLARSRSFIATPSAELFLHHFATDAWHGASGMRACQNFHMDSRGWADIAYSFCVDLDGKIYEARGAGIRGAHTSGHNSIAHAICLMSDNERNPLTKAQIHSAALLAAHGQQQGWWNDWTGGHRQASGASTACPGRYGMGALPDIRELTRQYGTTAAHPAPNDPSEENDMDIIGALKNVYSACLLRNPAVGELTDWVNHISAQPDRDAAARDSVLWIASSPEAERNAGEPSGRVS